MSSRLRAFMGFKGLADPALPPLAVQSRGFPGRNKYRDQLTPGLGRGPWDPSLAHTFAALDNEGAVDTNGQYEHHDFRILEVEQ